MKVLWVLLRILLGWQFLWAFIDKTFGFGFSTAPENAWIYGGSPTAGFLQMGSRGPFAPFFSSIGGTVLVDWLYMMAMLALGLSLIFGLLVRFSSIAGIIVLALMYLAAIPPTTNPFIDYHIIFILVLVGIFAANAGKYFGLDYFIFRKRPAGPVKQTVVQQKQVVKEKPAEVKAAPAAQVAPEETAHIPKDENIVVEEEQKAEETEETLEEEQMK